MSSSSGDVYRDDSEAGLVKQSTDSENLVDIILQGGPTDIPRRLRIRYEKVVDGKVKIERLGGYEHFQRIEDPSGADGARRAVFKWTDRTKIAE